MKNEAQSKRKRVRRRRFVEDEYHHIYQRTIHKFNIFYDVQDYLVYFTIFSMAVRQYGISVLGLCLMYDHVHMLLSADTKVAMSEFVRQVTSMFVREQNNDVGRKGSLFQARFGSAPKKGLKLLRTAISYLYNNPVEKRLSIHAEGYRWNFLAYAVSKTPFSEPIVIRNSSLSLRKAVKEVDASFALFHHLRYGQLSRMYRKLDESEAEQLTDYIISLYNPIDYSSLVKCYGSYEMMLTAINSNTGSEYDIKEERSSVTDTCYPRMLELIKKVEGIHDARKLTAADQDKKIRLYKLLSQHIDCPGKMIAEFLHLELKRM